MFVQLNFPKKSGAPYTDCIANFAELSLVHGSTSSASLASKIIAGNHWNVCSRKNGCQVTVYISLLKDCSEKLQLLAKETQQIIGELDKLHLSCTTDLTHL